LRFISQNPPSSDFAEYSLSNWISFRGAHQSHIADNQSQMKEIVWWIVSLAEDLWIALIGQLGVGVVGGTALSTPMFSGPQCSLCNN